MAPTLLCPSCQSGFRPPVAACPTCGLALTGPLAVELWQTEQQLTELQNRRAELLTQLRQGVGVERPVTVGGAAASDGTLNVPPLTVARSSGWTGQQVLLGAGALLLLSAAVVFVAVAWSVIGVAGQVAALGLLTVGAGAGSLALARRRLRASAETAALITVGLATVDATAAWELNLAGLGRVNGDGYGAVAAAVLAMVFVVLADRAPALRTFGLAGVAAAALVPAFALAAADPSAVWITGVALASAVVFTGLRRLLPTRLGRLMLPIALASAGWLVISWFVATSEVWSPSTKPLGWRWSLTAALGLAGAAGGIVASGLVHGLASAARRAVLAVASALVAAVILVGVAQAGGVVWLAALVGVAAVATAVSCWGARSTIRLAAVPVSLFAQLLVVGGLLTLADAAEVATRTPSWAALTLALAFVCAGGAVVLLRQTSLQVVATGYTVGFGLLTVAVLVYPSGGVWSTSVLALVGVALALVAARQRGHGNEPVLAAAAGAAWLYALVSTQRVPFVCAPLAAQFPGDRCLNLGAALLAAVLAVGGLTAFAYGILPRRGWVSLLGVLACSASVWTLAADRDVSAIEAYSLPLAALLALVGLIRLRRQPQAPSWITIGPALSVALLPSAVASLDNEGLARPLVVLVAGAAVLALGVYLHWQSPVLTGGLSVGLIAVSQLAPYAMGAPRWLSLGLVGVLLLAGGARYEQRRRNARQAFSWVGALH